MSYRRNCCEWSGIRGCSITGVVRKEDNSLPSLGSFDKVVDNIKGRKVRENFVTGEASVSVVRSRHNVSMVGCSLTRMGSRKMVKKICFKQISEWKRLAHKKPRWAVRKIKRKGFVKDSVEDSVKEISADQMVKSLNFEGASRPSFSNNTTPSFEFEPEILCIRSS